MNFLHLIFPTFYFTLTSGSILDFSSSNCQSASNCSSCFLLPKCSWCLDTGYKGTYRCDNESNLLSSGCEKSSILSAKPEFLLIEDKQQSEHIKVRPQSVKVRLRPGNSYSFEVKYRHLDKYETDVYALSSPVGSLSIQLSFTANCPGAKNQENVCLRVKKGEIVTINVTVTLDKCTEANSRGTYVSIAVAGGSEPIMLHVEPICKCDCDKYKEALSNFCGRKGDLVCGSCNCKKSYSGPNCECSVPPGTTFGTLIQHCKMTKTSEVCSGRGKCDCGKCACVSNQVTGKFCECDNQACVSSNGLVCNGNGNCSCGTCECSKGWSGDTCDCTADIHGCLDSNKQICGGHGKCLCGKCECDRDYVGFNCNRCLSCSLTISTTETVGKLGISPRKTEKKSAGQNVSLSTSSHKLGKNHSSRLSLPLNLLLSVCVLAELL